MCTTLSVLFVTLDSYGHLNPCIGVAQQLAARGHRVKFAVERAWQGKAARYEGIEEVVYSDPTRDPHENANEHWVEYMEKYLAYKQRCPLTPLEELREMDLEMEEEFLYTMLNVDRQLAEIIEQHSPDVVVADSYVTIPAVYLSGRPWVWLASYGPLICLPSPLLPPTKSGYPVDGDRQLWKEYRELEESLFGPMMARLHGRLAREYGIEAPPPGLQGNPSPHLNLYAYPLEIDYLHIRPLPPKWFRCDHFMRSEPDQAECELPASIREGTGKLVYVSMGTLASASLALIERLLHIASLSPNRFVFSLGPHHARYSLPGNVWGMHFVPQTRVLPLVDLVVTHGGNNTLAECFYFGKPMLVGPFFGDQMDNAQRVTETGFGDRFDPFHDSPAAVLAKIERLLSDWQLRQRVQAVSERIKREDRVSQMVTAIENIV